MWKKEENFFNFSDQMSETKKGKVKAEEEERRRGGEYGEEEGAAASIAALSVAIGLLQGG